MTAVVTVLRRGLVRADDALLSVRDRMTRGQRWTATILATIAVALVLYGAPSRTVILPFQSGGDAGSSTVAERQPRTPFVATTPGGVEIPPAPVTGARGRTSIAGPTGGAATGSTSSALPRISVLLPAAGSGTLPGRDERSVAEALLASPPFEVTATATVGDEGACAAVGGTGTLVLAPEALPDDLLSCVRASGATVLAFHRAGSSDGIISTRHGEPAALVTMSRWAASAKGVLDGKVGIVGGASDKAWIEAAMPAMRAAGLQVVEAAFPSDVGSVGSAVRAFDAAGVTDVVLAAPADIRRQWSAQHAIVDSSVRFVVADAHDGVADEGYAPSFDGALAHTTLRVPWFTRDHGETAEQAVCRQQWEASARRLLPGAETHWVYAWCQHISAAAAARGLAAESGRSVPVVLRDLRIPSPLTSDLGPGTDGWGPTQSAVVVWRAACRCWQEQTPFG